MYARDSCRLTCVSYAEFNESDANIFVRLPPLHRINAFLIREPVDGNAGQRLHSPVPTMNLTGL